MGLISFILKWAFIMFIVLVLIVAGAFAYLYYFYTFQTIRVCAPEQSIDTNISCKSNQQCLDTFKSNVQEINTMTEKLNDAPEKIKTIQQSLISGIFVCEQTCRIRQLTQNSVRGVAIFSKAPPCNPGEVELAKVDIKGKDLLPIINYMRKNPSVFNQ